MSVSYETVNILGAPVAVLDLPGIIARWEELLHEPGCATSYAVNTHSLNMTYRSQEHLAALRAASLVYADGASILLAAKILGRRLPERLTTTDLWHPFCRLAEEKGYSFFILGGPQELVEETRRVTEQQYPRLKIAGIRNGYFDVNDTKVIEEINAARPDILWVGMGDPRQSTWTERHRAALDVKLAITCGGMYKIITGQLRRAPVAWQKAGLEWLYRWSHEPVRTFGRYFIGLPAFGLRVVAQRLFRHRGRVDAFAREGA